MEYNEIAALIRRLEETPILSDKKARDLHRIAFDDAFSGMLEGKTYGQAMGGLAILNQPEDEFRAQLKSINDDLSAQIAIVNEALDGWFSQGETPPPYYAWRIAVVLAKAKRKSEEAAFLGAWCKHFGGVKGTRYEALAARARKLGAY